ncbi:hypothetical protein HDU81_002988 [Chytriomyces hyalinus]|nr:hypothetical protein HDU81_002988 [Chytriomyces hyalinus]
MDDSGIQIPAGAVRVDRANILGKGSFGVVYAATYNSRSVAVKCLVGVDTVGARRAFENEARQWFGLKHKYIVSLLGISVFSETEEGSVESMQVPVPPMLVMERMSTSVYTAIYSDAVPPFEKRLRWLSQTARAFRHLHHRCKPAVLHLDLKPDNILIDNKGNAQVADFGLARVLILSAGYTVDSIQTRRHGAYLYAPPESFEFGYRPTTKHDVYCFAMTMYEILGLQFPFFGENIVHAKDWVKRGLRPEQPETAAIPEHYSNNDFWDQLQISTDAAMVPTPPKAPKPPSYIKVEGKKFHVEHFSCEADGCDNTFPDKNSSYLQNDKILCAFHYAKSAQKCKGCNFPIMKEFVDDQGNADEGTACKWHPTCSILFRLWGAKLKIAPDSLKDGAKDPAGFEVRISVVQKKLLGVLPIFDDKFKAVLAEICEHCAREQEIKVYQSSYVLADCFGVVLTCLKLIAEQTAAKNQESYEGIFQHTQQLIIFFKLLANPVEGQSIAELEQGAQLSHQSARDILKHALQCLTNLP